MIRDDKSEYEYKKHYEPFLDNYNEECIFMLFFTKN